MTTDMKAFCKRYPMKCLKCSMRWGFIPEAHIETRDQMENAFIKKIRISSRGDN